MEAASTSEADGSCFDGGAFPGAGRQQRKSRAGVKEIRTVARRECEVQIATVSDSTVRLSILPIENGRVESVKGNGSLAQDSWGEPLAKLRGDFGSKTVKSGNLSVSVASNDNAAMTFAIADAHGKAVQKLSIDPVVGAVSFLAGDAPLLGLGEGGPQFDRRGSVDHMVSGQGGYKLETHGGRVPIPWLIGTAGWGIYFISRLEPLIWAVPQRSFYRARRNLLCRWTFSLW